MKSSTLIASYLWKDTWKRWLEQPTSPLARVFVTASLVAVATIILVAFEMAERSLRERLDNFGFNTLLVRRTITSASSEFIRQGESADALNALDNFGQELRLRQLFARAETEWQQSGVLVFSYSQKAMACLANLMSPTTPVLYLSETLPQETLVSVRIGRRTLLASVARPRGWLHALSSEDILLVPQGWLPDQEQLGWLETTVFQRSPNAPPMDKIAAAVNILFSSPNEPDPQIQSAIPLIHELDALRTRRIQLQGLLALLLGAVVSLVYGAIAWLEFRQNLFVGALLRSFGVPKRLLYLAYLIENFLLVNAAALATVFIVAYLHQGIFQSFTISNFGGGNPYFSVSLASVFLWVNLGAFLSSLPVAFGLRRQVGEILN